MLAALEASGASDGFGLSLQRGLNVLQRRLNVIDLHTLDSRGQDTTRAGYVILREEVSCLLSEYDSLLG